MIGIDSVRISRLEPLIHDEAFVEMILSDNETVLYQGIHSKAQYLATRFAAKEALFKAMTNQVPLDFSAISVCHHPSGRPYFKEYPTYGLSITHTEDLVIAVVIEKETV